MFRVPLGYYAYIENVCYSIGSTTGSITPLGTFRLRRRDSGKIFRTVKTDHVRIDHKDPGPNYLFPPLCDLKVDVTPRQNNTLIAVTYDIQLIPEAIVKLTNLLQPTVV